MTSGAAEPVSNQPVWELEADQRLLDPGPRDLHERHDVLVVGGGVIGLTTAALCRQAGLGRVAVVERGRLAAGPSGRGGGILAPELHRGADPASLLAFGLSSLALGIEAGSGGVRVRTDRGDLHAGAVVLATGGAPAVQGVPPAAGQSLVKGTLVATAPAPFRLRLAIGGRGGLAGQLPDGRLLFGNTFDPTDRSPEVRPEALAATRADLEALIPDAAGLALSHAWSCFRPATAAGLPVIDKVDGLEHVWATYGHFRTGFLLAAATGQALATWISGGERPDELAAFGARRGPDAAGPYLG